MQPRRGHLDFVNMTPVAMFKTTLFLAVIQLARAGTLRTLSTPCEHAGAPGSAGYCTAACPCAIGEGHCEDDNQCAATAKCIGGLGDCYGFPGGTAVCSSECSRTCSFVAPARSL